MSDIAFIQTEFHSSRLNNTRTVWIQPPSCVPAEQAQGVCIFLDGEFYLGRVRAAGIVDRLQRDGTLPSQVVAYVSHIGHPTRWEESFCNPDFAYAIAEELLPWLLNRHGLATTEYHLLVGLSLTGLSAAHTALCYPNRFPGVLCQSGSFWWNDGWLAEHAADFPPTNTAFRITVGDEETKENVDHGDGLIQVQSQVASNTRMRDVLLASGNRVSFATYSGDHIMEDWRDDLPASLSELSTTVGWVADRP